MISVYDHGFLYGMGLFETFRTYQGAPYLLERHLARLMEGCRALGIAYEPDQGEIRSWLRRLMAANALSEAYVRLTVTAGEGELGLPQHGYDAPNVLMMVKPLPPVHKSLDREGKQLALLHTARNTPEGQVRFKSLHYMNNILAKHELRASGAAAGAEGLMLTREGHLAEGIVSNLFFVSQGVIHTPSVDTGILPGITRGRVLELAKEAGHATEEGYYTWEQLLGAEEIWITNSVQELVPITTLRDGDGAVTTIGNGLAGPITGTLVGAYRADTRIALP
ncbi:4-amino-4-deoxychorismate lyase [Paenibacillus phyllosphaerae]|uniref:4-amino-4-deoxychorismate lyase n=1 Tax=Paenibacillus phyllosphaerae TaxID=274593 RepID=A0A7W5FR49_9BACL|nr:4-amino-4-deoxychorismate lyase [Paenibacillus phyllosphaerae]